MRSAATATRVGDAVAAFFNLHNISRYYWLVTGCSIEAA